MASELLNQEHEFHIPVMGTAFTIDTPLKVARFGISSVVSLCDDELCEAMRMHYSKLFQLDYDPISEEVDDFRGKRITAYLNLLDQCVKDQINRMKQESFDDVDSDLVTYFELLPDSSYAKCLYADMIESQDALVKEKLQAELRALIRPGSIDVNIMTKLDRDTYDKQAQKRDSYYSDAISALRGFANSTLNASIVFSAGFNRRLFAYLEHCADFYPDKNGALKKRIVLKVSDFRSSLTQGKFLAKKGIWVSEYRIESGLNCGGHAFATDGYLMGPILEEFKRQKKALVASLFGIYNDTLEKLNKLRVDSIPFVDITVQGGIGTANENRFLIDHYHVKRTGWATPFLLASDVTLLDDETRMVLLKADADDLYLSPVSPLGVPFNTVRHTLSEQQKYERFEKGRPGSPCPKGYLVSNTEFSKKPVCTASIFYQKRKIEQLKSLNLDSASLKKSIERVVVKSCLCEDLAAGALLKHDISNKRPLKSAVCPGPNLAYFSRLSSLKEMVGHIYGRLNLLNDKYRSNLFISELKMYIAYFKKEVANVSDSATSIELKYIQSFKDNLLDGISYYDCLIPKLVHETHKYRDKMTDELRELKSDLHDLISSNSSFFLPVVQTVV
ncbi:hypothetical protein DID74_01200 [Candidatus Marinamargulisbacteria bacterium SCGC AG-333-B06]|nr:hypothetical protein DID74_01200 [Candidatus Marinamargulisbacteria bacterium SCGC AG-333-B06]